MTRAEVKQGTRDHRWSSSTEAQLLVLVEELEQAQAARDALADECASLRAQVGDAQRQLTEGRRLVEAVLAERASVENAARADALADVMEHVQREILVRGYTRKLATSVAGQVLRALATAAPGKAPETCATCHDTHLMQLGEREVMCTHCPTPCGLCSGGAFCKATPCDCGCHMGRAGKAPAGGR